jgi:hypothetical protein
MSKLLKKIAKFFEIRPQSGLEAFISSKRPQSTAEVEQWARYYDQHKGNVWSNV